MVTQISILHMRSGSALRDMGMMVQLKSFFAREFCFILGVCKPFWILRIDLSTAIVNR